MKTCPDCAEQVLAPVRKCRYCGFRFDTPLSRGPAGVLPDLRPRTDSLARREVVAKWGVALPADEAPAMVAFERILGTAT